MKCLSRYATTHRWVTLEILEMSLEDRYFEVDGRIDTGNLNIMTTFDDQPENESNDSLETLSKHRSQSRRRRQPTAPAFALNRWHSISVVLVIAALCLTFSGIHAGNAVNSATAKIKQEIAPPYARSDQYDPAAAYEAREALRAAKQGRLIRFGLAFAVGLMAIGAFMHATQCQKASDDNSRQA